MTYYLVSLVALVWNWYEVLEGASVSLVFILIPLLWRIERHHGELVRHAQRQTMLAEENHYLAHHGKPHPRVQARVQHGQDQTPVFV